MDQAAILLIIKKLSGEFSQEEDKELHAWLNSNNANQALFQQVEKTWTISATLYPEYEPDTAKEWEKLKGKIGLSESTAKIITITHVNRLRVAAAILGIVVFGFLVKYMLSDAGNPSDNNLRMVAVTTTDSAVVFYLPDSSKLVLNINSSITYAKDFTDTARIINLSGEAYYDVRKNGRPFIVYAGGTQVRVMGTSFNIKANEADDDVEVVVFSGEVAFSEQGSSPSSAVKLRANDKVNYSKTEKSSHKQKNDSKEYWWQNVDSEGSTLEKEAKKILNKIKNGLRKK